MLAAITKVDADLIWAKDVSEEAAQSHSYLCPCCSAKVTLVQRTQQLTTPTGKQYKPYFKHKDKTKCKFGAGELEAHLAMKYDIYRALRKDTRVSSCDMELDLGDIRPDIIFSIKNKTGQVKVAIEVQLSCITPAQLSKKTRLYAEKNIYVLWLRRWTDKLLASKYSTSIWERWIHDLYYGRVYYWHSGLNMIPVHYKKHYHQSLFRGAFEASVLVKPYIATRVHILNDCYNTVHPMDDAYNKKARFSLPNAKIVIEKNYARPETKTREVMAIADVIKYIRGIETQAQLIAQSIKHSSMSLPFIYKASYYGFEYYVYVKSNQQFELHLIKDLIEYQGSQQTLWHYKASTDLKFDTLARSLTIDNHTGLNQMGFSMSTCNECIFVLKIVLIDLCELIIKIQQPSEKSQSELRTLFSDKERQYRGHLITLISKLQKGEILLQEAINQTLNRLGQIDEILALMIKNHHKQFVQTLTRAFSYTEAK